jgi:predicted heme/steroid binding protein
VTISNSTFTNNQTLPSTSGGGAIFYRPTQAGSLTISGSTFNSNTAGGIGGAIATATFAAGTTVSITNSTFNGNTATNSFGGALDLNSTTATTTPFSLSHLIITGNHAGISGGGIFVGNSNVNISKSLIVGNTAPTGSGLHKSVDAATATVTNNWWGCSTGPGATPCDTATTAGGTLNFTPWYRDQLTASTSPIATNQSTSLTASFLTNSANTAVPVADLAEIIGRSVTWAATNGNLSGTQGTVQAAGTATGSFQATSAGTAILSAKVDNDNTSPVSSNVLSLTINKANTTTALLTHTPDPSVTNQSVTVTYSVTGAFGNSPTAPTGNVTVSDGVNSCVASVAAGSCNITIGSAGAKTLTATYAGDANFNSSVSAGVSHTVNKANTTTVLLTHTPDPSVTNQPVAVTYSVTGAFGNSPTAPTGNVTVSDGVNSCVASAAAGTCNITFSTPGAKTLTATYVGDANFNGSASVGVSHTVNKANTTTTITSDTPDPSVIGQSVTVNYSVAGAFGNSPTAPTGNVTVSDGVDSCVALAAAGTCNITFSTPGAKTLTATYAGDVNFNGSASAGVSHAVNKANTTTTITSDNPDPSLILQSVTVNFTVTVNSPGAGTPSGNVNVSDGVDSCTGTAASGTCSLTLTTPGARTLTATYVGDGNFNGSASAGEPHTAILPDTSIVSLDRASGNPTGNSTVTWQVIFADPVDGLTASNFALLQGGFVSGASISSVTETSGPPSTTWNITANTGSGDGTLGLNFANDTGLTHNVTNSLPYVGGVYTIDRTPPTVTINQAAGQLDPTGVSPINFTAVFSEPVTGFATGDVTLGGGANPATGTVTEIAPNNGTTFNVAVSGMSGDGTVTASIAAGVAQDAAGSGNQASTSGDNSVVYDTVAPSVTINQAGGQLDPTNASPIHFTVVFSEPVTGFATGDVTLGGTANPVTGAVSEIAPNDGTTFDVAVSGMTNDGTVTASIGAGVALDAGNNGNTASIGADNTVTYDGTAPTVTINQAVGQVDPTNGSTINFTVVFSEPVTGFVTGDVTLGGTANPTTGTVTEIAPTDGTTFNVAVSGMTNDGTVIPTITAGKAQDPAGNSNAASASTDNTVTYDATAPTATIDQAAGQTDPTGLSPINFTVVFSEPITGFTDGEVSLGGTTGATTSIVTEIAPTDGTTYNVAVSGMTSDGTVTASLAAGVAQDAAGNDNDASTSGDNSVVYDTVAPSVTINQAAGQVDPTNSSTINFTAVFSEPVTGFATGDVTLSGTAGASTGTVTEIAPNDGTTYNVAVSGMTVNGTVIASIDAGKALDAGNNGNSASTSTDHTVNYDATAPTVTIDQATGQADPTNASPVNFTVVFSETVIGFATGDVTLGGTAGATTGTVSEIAPNDGTTYNVAVSGMTTGGTIIATINAAVAQDTAANGNAAATSTDNTVNFTFDTTTTITSDTPDPSIVGEAVTFNYSVTVNNSGTGTPSGNVTVSSGSDSCTGSVASGSCTITFATPGARTLTAVYEGDTNFNTSTSAAVSHQVNNANTTTTITSDAPDPSMAGDAVTVNFTVAVVAPGTGTPTGNVTVTDGVDSCTGTVASGSCSITLTTSGLRSLSAAYEGNVNFGSSTSAAESHTVNAAPAITSPDHITFVIGLPGSFTVLTTGFPIPSLSNLGALPSGVSFVDNGNGTATLDGTPVIGSSGTYPLTFTASNGTTDATQNFILTVSIDPIFADVPNSYWAAPYINAIYYAGITGGCTVSPLNYCPTASVTRAEMAVFLKRGIHGSSYQPPLPASFHFTDIIGHWAQNWIEDLYSEGITGGCGLSPFSYCPNQPVTRDQMAVFLLLLKNGASYTPPAATGAVFTDVPADQWAAAWIEELAAEGITAGCGGGKYCPNAPVTRAEMAVLLVTTLNLTLP